MPQIERVDKLAEIQKWCKPVSDEEAARFLPKKDASAIANLRKFAKEVFEKKVFDWKENIFYKVEAGFDFQKHAPKIGPCIYHWEKARRWKLQNKESTCDSLVFWIPRLLPGSCLKKTEDQLKLMADYRKKYGLPENCLKNFGSASLNTLLILERFHRIREVLSFGQDVVRTDTLRANGRDTSGLHLCLDFAYVGGGSKPLDCNKDFVLVCLPYGYKYLDSGVERVEDVFHNVGCFPVGVWNLPC